jgi:hypothetical protein
VDKTDASAQNGQEMSFYQHGLDWNPKMISENGSVIKDDNGYWNPDNWGHPVEINSNNITMQGVNQPLLGISDTGHTQLMHPGEEYKFKGKKVTEFPIAQNGKKLPNNQPTQQTKIYTDKKEYQKAMQAKNDSDMLYNLSNDRLDALKKQEEFQKNYNSNDPVLRNQMQLLNTDFLKKGDKLFNYEVDHNLKNGYHIIEPTIHHKKGRYGGADRLTYKKSNTQPIYQKEVHHTNPGNGEIVPIEHPNLQQGQTNQGFDRNPSSIDTREQPTNYSFHYPIEGTFDKGNPQGVKYFKDRAEWQNFLDENDYNSAEEKNGIGQASGTLKKGRNGLRQEQKSLVNLDQLTNFTNYNTPQLGGWMDRYTQ